MEINKNYNSSILHSDGHILYVSDQIVNLLGLEDSKSAENKYLKEYVFDSDWEKLCNQFDKVIEEDITLGLKINLIKENGEKVSVIAVSSCIKSHKDVINTIIMNITDEDCDLTQPMRENAMHKAPVGITIANVQMEDEPLIYVNDGFVDITGYSREDIIGQNCRFLQGENTSEKAVNKMRSAINNNERCTVKLRNYKKDGTEFWNRVTIAPVENDSEEDVKYYLGFQEDITESKLHEQEKTIFEKHVEESSHAMFFTDDNWIIEYVNPAFEEITGYSREEAIGKTPSILRPDNIDTVVYDEIDKTINNCNEWRGELKNVKKSGEIYHSKQTITPLFNNKGEVMNFTVIQEDITQKKINQQVMNVLNRVLRHNLRSSINVIEGHINNLDKNDYNQTRMSISAISSRIDSMKKIGEKMTKIRNLLNSENKQNYMDVKELKRIVKNYKNKTDAEIKLNIDGVENKKIKNGDLFQIAFEEAIENATLNNHKENSKVHVNTVLSKKNILQVEIVDNKENYSRDKWDIIKSGKETPLRHTDGIGLWVMYWSITAIGGSIELFEYDEGNEFIMRVPLVSD